MSSAPPEAGRIEDFRFLADLNISPQTVGALRKQGWQISRSSETLALTAPDEEILDFARQEESVVLTQDLDFSALLALGGYDRPSLVTLRLSTSEPGLVAQRLLETAPLLETTLSKGGCAITIEDSSVRIRRLPIR
jgi:predicted nuclease of predicted toxin-antitoxin system